MPIISFSRDKNPSNNILSFTRKKEKKHHEQLFGTFD